MAEPLIRAETGVTLAGGGELAAATLAAALARAPLLVAADGGADRALALGHVPAAVIGDMDSLGPAARAALPPDRLHRIAEQETTDFDKCLRSVAAPFVIGVGLTGPRFDHALAALNVLARHPGRRCLILGARDVTFLCPPALRLALPVGTRLSLFPLGPVAGRSQGLRWPIDGIALDPADRIGTSNETVAPEVALEAAAPRLLVILPAAALDAALRALGAAPATVAAGR